MRIYRVVEVVTTKYVSRWRATDADALRHYLEFGVVAPADHVETVAQRVQLERVTEVLDVG